MSVGRPCHLCDAWPAAGIRARSRRRVSVSSGVLPSEVSLFGIGDVLTAWELDPVPTIGVGLVGLGYLAAWRRVGPGRPRRSLAAFGAGLLVVLVAINGPPDALSDTSFSAHMVQHLLMVLVAAPLLLVGAPVSLLLRADPRWLPRRVLAGILRSRAIHLVSRPVVTFALFAAVLVGSHFSPVYNLALEWDAAHQLEHVAYLVTALLFWWPAIGTDPGPRKPSHPARLLYLLLIMPVMALPGVAIAATDELLYPYYAAHPPPWGASAIQDQHLAGTLMWIIGMITMPPSLALVLLRWLDEDDRDEARLTARSSAAHIGRTSPPTPLTAEGAR